MLRIDPMKKKMRKKMCLTLRVCRGKDAETTQSVWVMSKKHMSKRLYKEEIGKEKMKSGGQDY